MIQRVFVQTIQIIVRLVILIQHQLKSVIAKMMQIFLTPLLYWHSAPVMHLTDLLHTVVTTNIPEPPTILGLSAAGLNAPVAPGPVNDLKLIMERTTSALRCLRQHILPDIHLKTEC